MQLLALLEQNPAFIQNRYANANVPNTTVNEIINAVQPLPQEDSSPPSEPTETQTPDRWHTPVSITHTLNGRITNVRYFTDLQMAYLYVKQQTQLLNDMDWDLSSFSETCSEMDRRWQRNQTGYTIALGEGCRFKAHYEPHMTSETIPRTAELNAPLNG